MAAEQLTIPRIIHTLCRDRRAPGPHWERIRALHPGWTLIPYDDQGMELILHTLFPGSKAAYYAFPKEIQRRDIFRMLITERQGGFYMDADIQPLKPLDDLLHHGLVLAEEKTLSAAEMQQPHHLYPLRIANYMFGCIPGHPFIGGFVKAALTNCSKPVRHENDVLETTGPGLLTNFYHEHKQYYTDIRLLTNNSLHCTKRCTPQPSCHFGDYAAHLHEGSWRWEA